MVLGVSAACPLHPSAALEPAIRDARDQFFGLEGTFSYERCTECRAMVLAPRPAPEEIGHFYSGYYLPETLAFLRLRASRGRPVGLMSRLRARALLRSMRRLGLDGTQELEALDVGCGLGALAGSLNRVPQITARGVDFTPECASFARDVHGVEVDVGELRDQNYPDARFDLVTNWHYLEHVYDPASELREMARITKPNGWLCVETPTPSFFARIFGNKWLYLMPPTHLYHYQPNTLAKLIEAAGFEVLAVKRPWMPGELAGSIMFALGLNGLVPKVFTPGRNRRERWLTVLFLLQMIYDVPLTLLTALLGGGGVVRVIARRRSS